MRKLQEILAQIPEDALPPAWSSFDLAAFSAGKRLWDYQQEALRYALKALWKYYEELGDYREGANAPADAERKARLFGWYRDNGLEDELDIPLERQRRDIRRLLERYYAAQNGKIPYAQFINRLGFWMATGSGKTLVIVKLIEVLWRLIRWGEIPAHNILMLTCRDDLLGQLRAHVNEFNAGGREPFIRLRDLREYPEAKRGGASLFGHQEVTVFYYRSDNLSDEQKERIVDYRNYEDHGQWYVLLDEAHKGDKEDSKRQHIYSILARNGFLFNFSATFTDPRDILTTAYDFNLARFIERGYGKHITILKQENRAFRDKEDYTGEEKQKVVLKALLMLAYVRRVCDEALQAAGRSDLYHKPLLLVLVNSVNTQDADLKLFFRELERVGKGEIGEAVWQQAKAELGQELAERPELLFEGQRFSAEPATFEAIGPREVLSAVFNAAGPGETEVWARPSNRQEVAFKLKSGDRPYALIRIGDISGWLKDELAGYEVIEGFEDEGFFERLNADDTDINVLMGSRSFYEGWDSNRPNVITYINIGMGTDARKFILQSVGRGVRIEPLAGQRKRIQALYNANVVGGEIYRTIKDRVLAMETLFILGTNRQALHTVIEQLDQEQGKEALHELALEINRQAVDDHLLLIPVYRRGERPLVEQGESRKFEIAEDELKLLRRYVEYLGDDRLLVALHHASPRQVRLLQQTLDTPDRCFNTHNGRRYGHVELILTRLLDYFQVIPEEVDGLKPLEDEINHFRHIRVSLEDIGPLRRGIEGVRRYPERSGLETQLRQQFTARQLSFDDLMAKMNELNSMVKESRVEYGGVSLDIRHIANHYYLPVLLSHDERIGYIQHIIRHPSEVRFVEDLERYVGEGDHRFGEFDWWLFSKLDEALDQVHIPYYDPQSNAMRRFNPDFVFWLQKGRDYHIVFVDPKGMQQSGYQHKVDGYRALFCDARGNPRPLAYGDLRVWTHLFLYTSDANQVAQGYRGYWVDSPGGILGKVAAVT